MTLEEIIKQWEIDAPINKVDLGGASSGVPYLHHRYLQYLTSERKLYKLLLLKKSKLEFNLFKYYKGDLNNTKELKELNRPPWSLKILRNDIDKYVNNDKEIEDLQIKIIEQSEKVDALERILHQLNIRSYQIKNHIEYLALAKGLD